MIDGEEEAGPAAPKPEGGDPAAAAAAAIKPEEGCSDGSGLPLGPEGHVPFFFMDAWENEADRPGEVFLFGKVGGVGGSVGVALCLLPRLLLP